jgi:hypothetical protein
MVVMLEKVRNGLSNDIEQKLIIAALKPYEFISHEGQVTYDIAQFLYDDNCDWQDVLKNNGFDSNIVSDFLKWYPNKEEWIVKLGVTREIIALAKDQVEVDISGHHSVMFSHLDFAKEKAWDRIRKGDPYIGVSDFVNPEKFKKYFIISLGLTEGTVVVHGTEGGGKSLWAYHMAHQLLELFEKKCTLMPKPKKPYWQYRADSITGKQLEEEIDYLKELTGRANDLTEEDEDSDELQSLLTQSKLYKRAVVDDESYQDLEKTRITNVTRGWGRLVRQYAHLHSLFMFLSPDKRDIAERLIYDRRTHEVSCSKHGGICHYTIMWRREGITRPMELDPKTWLWLWRRDNLVGGGTTMKLRGL